MSVPATEASRLIDVGIFRYFRGVLWPFTGVNPCESTIVCGSGHVCHCVAVVWTRLGRLTAPHSRD